MKLFKAFTMALLMMAFTLIGPWAHAQNASAGDSKWEFHVIPYFWMAGLGGDVTVRDIEVDVDAKFSDIFDHFDYGGALHLEV
jgi:hypothetical protein